MNVMGAAGTLLLTDFDGTLYRGLIPALTRGVANADLALALCLLSLPGPARFARAVRALARLRRLERRLHRLYRAGKTSLSDMDERLVREFAGGLLARCDAPMIARAARVVSGLCHRDAWPTLQRLGPGCEIVVVSKSFDFLLEEVRRRAAARGLALEYRGIRTTNRRAILADGSVLRAEDKHAATVELLRTRAGRVRRAIAIGDTEDDVAMKRGAEEILGPANVLFVALHPRDERVRRAAARTFRNWRALGAFLDAHAPHPIRIDASDAL